MLVWEGLFTMVGRIFQSSCHPSTIFMRLSQGETEIFTNIRGPASWYLCVIISYGCRQFGLHLKNDSDMIIKLMKQIFPHLSTDGASKLPQQKALSSVWIPLCVIPGPLVFPAASSTGASRAGSGRGRGWTQGMPMWASQGHWLSTQINPACSAFNERLLLRAMCYTAIRNLQRRGFRSGIRDKAWPLGAFCVAEFY